MKLHEAIITRFAPTPLRLLTLLTAGLLAAPSANAELTVALFSGKSITDDGDLNLNQGNTNLNFHNVRWKDDSFGEPIYYGARIGYWLNNQPNWGFAVDFTHLKTILVEGDTVWARGVSNGVPVNSNQPISNSISDFEMTHGLNLVTFNGMYRWFPAGQRDSSLLGRMQLYTGLGAGFSVPHVEATIKGVDTFRYQWGAGPVVNGMMGINYDIYSVLSGFLEYKLSYADVHADLTGGGSISTQTVNHQLVFGLAAHFDL